MKLDDVEQVTMLKSHRVAALNLRKASGAMLIEANVWDNGKRRDVFSVLSAEPIRAAIFNECTVVIIKLEAELKALGVHISNTEPIFEGTLESWRDTAHMYCSAWKRELGDHMGNKRHLIDAMVEGTKIACAAAQENKT